MTSMKSVWMIGIVATALLLPAALAQNRGGDAGKAKGGKGGDGGSGGDGSVIQLPKISPEQLAAFEKGLTPGQKKLLDDYVTLELKLYARAGGHLAAINADDLRKQTLTWLAAGTVEEQAEYWKRMPEGIVMLHRRLDPLYLSDDQKRQGQRAAADTKDIIEKLIGDDVDAYLEARRRLLTCGEPCLPLLADRAGQFGPEHPKTARLVEVFNQIEANQAAEKMIRVIEASEKRFTEVKKQAGKDSQVVVMLSRQLTSYGAGGASRLDPRAKNCYYSFPKAKHGYEGAVSLGFGNGSDEFGVRMYGGQDNRIKDLGPVDFSTVKSVPGPKETENWKDRAPTVVGHVYLEHCVEPRDNVNHTAAFKVLDLQPGQWVIIEWKNVPQAKDPS